MSSKTKNPDIILNNSETGGYFNKYTSEVVDYNNKKITNTKPLKKQTKGGRKKSLRKTNRKRKTRRRRTNRRR